MSIIQGTAHTSAGGYQIQRSLRFNSADSAYLNRTPATTTNRKTFTWSGWVKRSALSGTVQIIFCGPGGSGLGGFNLGFNTSEKLAVTIDDGTSTYVGSTSAVYRDVSSWYHIVLTIDTTQATAANRIKTYVNGSQVTLNTDSGAIPAQNADTNVNLNSQHTHGRRQFQADFYLNGYLTEVNFIDGQALTPSSFGETSTQTGVWQPKAYTGTYGANGFYLKFADNSGTTSTTLGKDSSGNGNNWTPNNFSVTAGAGNDSLVDTPTSYGSDTGAGGEVRGNYATMNPLTPPVNGSLSNGNLLFTGATDWGGSKSTIAIPTTGKWYAEFTLGSTSSNSAQADVGIFPSGNTNYYDWTGSYGLELNNSFFLITNGSYSFARSGTTAGGTVLQIAVDADAGKVWFGVANAWYDTFNTTNGNPGAGTNPSGSSINFSTTTYFMGVKTDFNNWTANFGQRPFAYTAPSGFKALCTQNLPTPTIGATSTTQANDYFNVVLYTGNGSSQTVTGFGFNPDMVWHKGRSVAYWHSLVDVIRGNSNVIFSNTTDAEQNPGAQLDLATDGATVTYRAANLANNQNAATYVIWGWKANGAGSSNTAGTITSTVSANTTAGFSIVTYTGTGTAGTIGHGLGVAPQMIIVKNRNTGSYGWFVWHTAFGAAGNTDYINLNLTDAKGSGGAVSMWNTTMPTSSVFSIGTYAGVNGNTNTYVVYCFAPVAGYSAFGSYTGNGSTDGPFVFCGFRPRYLLVKNISVAEGWEIMDTARNTYNAVNSLLEANQVNAEITNTSRDTDYLSNGFKVRNTSAAMNTNGNTYIYAAFAESPFKYSLAR